MEVEKKKSNSRKKKELCKETDEVDNKQVYFLFSKVQQEFPCHIYLLFSKVLSPRSNYSMASFSLFNLEILCSCFG